MVKNLVQVCLVHLQGWLLTWRGCFQGWIEPRRLSVHDVTLREQTPLKTQLKPTKALPFLRSTHNPSTASPAPGSQPRGSARLVATSANGARSCVLRALTPRGHKRSPHRRGFSPCTTPALGLSQPGTRSRRRSFAEIRGVPYILLHNPVAGEVLREMAP